MKKNKYILSNWLVLATILLFLYVQIVSAATVSEDYTIRFEITGYDGRIDLPTSDKVPSVPMKSLNLYFTSPYYEIGSIQYYVYDLHSVQNRLDGAINYFSLSSDLSITQASSIELESENPITVYQFFDSGWKPRPTEHIGNNRYQASIEKWGLFAVAPTPQEQVRVTQPTVSIYQKISNLFQKINEMYEKLNNWENEHFTYRR